MMNRPDTLAEVAQRLKADPSDRHGPVAGFLDNFYTRPERRQEMLDSEPELTGDDVVDATLGAIGEHLARRWNLSVPKWTEQPTRFLKRPHFASTFKGLKPMLMVQSPLAFRRRFIFTEHEPLKRARMQFAATTSRTISR